MLVKRATQARVGQLGQLGRADPQHGAGAGRSAPQRRARISLTPVRGTPSMRGPLSSAAGADFALRASRTSPFAVGFGRSGPSQTCPRTNWLCNPQHILSSPRPRESFLPLLAGSIRCGSRRDVIRSTIYSGSPGRPDVATTPESKGCHHSYSRSSAMGPRSWCPTGSSAWSSRPPAVARLVARSPELARFGSFLC
jgi:hypothetical protein